MKYTWSDGFHPPKGVTAEKAMAAVEALPSPTPEALLQASKRKRHVLHNHLWAEGDQVWAHRARLTECRRIIGHIKQNIVIGGTTMEVRAVEYVRDGASGASGVWASMQSILESPDLLKAHLADVHRAQEQASARLARLMELIDAKGGD